MEQSNRQNKNDRQQQQNNLLQQAIKYQHDLAFVIDIDGTLTISHKQIHGASDALNYLAQSNFPYILLTNNISKSQQTLAQQVNSILKLKVPLKSQQIILNFTPTKDIVDWTNTTTLLVGRQVKFQQILPLAHIKKYVTIEQYCTLFPQLVPLRRRVLNQRSEQVKAIVEQRLKIKNASKQNIKFGVIFIILCPIDWQQSLQIIMDILNSQDGGFPMQKNTYQYIPNHIPVVATNNDLLYMVSNCNLPRILIQPFNEMVKSTFKRIYGHQLEIHVFGKPQKPTYQYTVKHCEKNYGKIKRYVMIGDNPDTDILGAYNFGWDSILFKSGVATQNLKIATVNCTNLLQGIQSYLRDFKPKNL